VYYHIIHIAEKLFIFGVKQQSLTTHIGFWKCSDDVIVFHFISYILKSHC